MLENRQVSKAAGIKNAGEGLVKYLNAIAGWPELNQSILVQDLERQLAEGSISFEHAANAIILFIRLEDHIAALRSCTESDRIRKCPCGCGNWFFARTQKQRHYGDHRKRAYERGMTEEQKKARRVRMQRFMAAYYNKNFKA
jgi:predicted RNA-binding Zn ribbon-like protein